MKFHTATLSHDDLRDAISEQLYELCDPTSWPWIVDVYEGFVFVKMRVGTEYGLHKIPYTITAADTVELGKPVLIAKKDPAQASSGTLALAATAKAITPGDEAADLLDTLLTQNPLFSSLKDSPNVHFVVFDLTTIGKASQHAGRYKYRLAKGGLEKAMPTLISKPIHVTAALDGHFDAHAAPKPIGTFLGGTTIDNADGTVTLRVIGTLWANDFPAEVDEIKERKADLGASYEIMYPVTAASAANGIVDISEYQFSGGAILLKAAAAHPESQLHVAHRGPLAPSPARPAAAAAASTIEQDPRRSHMPTSTKYPGVALEHEPLIDAAIAAQTEKIQGGVAVAELKTQLAEKEKLIAAATYEHSTCPGMHAVLTTRATTAETKVTELEAELKTVKTQLEAATTAAAALQAEKDAADLKAKTATKMAEIAKKHGLSAAQQAEPARLAIVQKLVAGKDVVSVEEFDSVIAGGTARNGTFVPARAEKQVPLYAGGGEGEGKPDAETVAKSYPAAVTRLYR